MKCKFLTPETPDPLNNSCLDLDGSVKSLLLLGNEGVGLVAHDSTSPVAAGLLVLVGVSLLDGGDELGELGLVLGADLSKSEDGSGLGYC